MLFCNGIRLIISVARLRLAAILSKSLASSASFRECVEIPAKAKPVLDVTIVGLLSYQCQLITRPHDRLTERNMEYRLYLVGLPMEFVLS